jgi:hypothetical protein
LKIESRIFGQNQERKRLCFATYFIQKSIGDIICKQCLPQSQSYSAAPPKIAAAGTNEAEYLGVVNPKSSEAISLIPSGYFSNPDNQFSPAILQNVSITVVIVYIGGRNMVMNDLFP